MSQSPLVSVVMCTYNGEQYLNEQVESIIQQEYNNLELVVVDDASTDHTWELLEEWRRKKDFVRTFKNQENLGYNRNFEYAIQLARGEFISLSDQDDVWLPQKISKTMLAFGERNVVLAHSKSVRLEGGELKYYKANLHYHFSGNDTRRLFLFNQVMGHDMIFKKELVNKIVPVPPGMSYDWWIAVIATCYGNISGVDEYLAHHRIHSHNNFFSKQAASKKKELDLEETLRLFETVPALGDDKRAFLEEFLRLLNEHNQNRSGKFDADLFGFLFRNRRILFGHKRRTMPELSYLKNAFKYAKLDYKGKGISI